jgi:hypothetical protein
MTFSRPRNQAKGNPDKRICAYLAAPNFARTVFGIKPLWRRGAARSLSDATTSCPDRPSMMVRDRPELREAIA